jgi:hypothetical protein
MNADKPFVFDQRSSAFIRGRPMFWPFSATSEACATGLAES